MVIWTRGVSNRGSEINLFRINLGGKVNRTWIWVKREKRKKIISDSCLIISPIMRCEYWRKEWFEEKIKDFVLNPVFSWSWLLDIQGGGRVAGIWQLLVNLPSSQWNPNLLRARTQSSSSCFAVQADREVAASDLKFLALCTSLVMMNSCCLSHFPHSPGKTHNNSCRLSSLKDYCEHQWDICKAYRALGGRKLFYKLWSIRVLTGWDVLARNILWLSHQKKNVKR